MINFRSLRRSQETLRRSILPIHSYTRKIVKSQSADVFRCSTGMAHAAGRALLDKENVKLE